ncbi:MAG: ATPase domain-containing protein [Halobacteriaceae archaeon]
MNNSQESPSKNSPSDRQSTGLSSLDHILHGGLIPARQYMIRGKPGTGKTIFGLHYLAKGETSNEDSLFIALEEPPSDIRMNAESVGIDFDDINCLDLTPGTDVFSEDQSYNVFEPNEVESGTVIDQITDRTQAIDPDRVFIDPLTNLRFLGPDEHQFRKYILSLKEFFNEHDATVLFSSESVSEGDDSDLQFLADGVIELQKDINGRILTVPKFRGSDIINGPHAFRINDEGIHVFPNITLGESQESSIESNQPIKSGVPELDELLHGGLERATVTVISGPTGVGKTTLGTQFMNEAAERGERSALYLFEETISTFLDRSQAINIPVQQMREQGKLQIDEIDNLDQSPQEFAQQVRKEVTAHNTSVVMIDGISGYKEVITEHTKASHLTQRLHKLTTYLTNQGITVILTDEVGSVTGDFSATGNKISYLADNIVFIQYIEVEGELRKAIGTLKMRASDFERRLREFQISSRGLKIGEPLTELRGILTGTPEITDGDGFMQSPDNQKS